MVECGSLGEPLSIAGVIDFLGLSDHGAADTMPCGAAVRVRNDAAGDVIGSKAPQALAAL